MFSSIKTQRGLQTYYNKKYYDNYTITLQAQQPYVHQEYPCYTIPKLLLLDEDDNSNDVLVDDSHNTPLQDNTTILDDWDANIENSYQATDMSAQVSDIDSIDTSEDDRA